MDVHTRRLRYFVAVAEELHFGRAAARFFIAQQAMSRQIQDLEADLGARLLERTTRRAELTPAGEAFLEAARTTLAALDAGVHAVQAASRSAVGVLTVGFRFGVALELTPPILQRLAAEHPGITLDLRELGFLVPGRTADDRPVDVALMRVPFDRDGLHFEPLVSEPRVIFVARTHELARRAAVTMDDLRDMPIVVPDTRDAVWRRFWTLDAERGGPPQRVLLARSTTEELEIVAAGEACGTSAASAARFMPHPAVVYVPIADVAPCTLGLAYPAGARSPLVEAFVATALAVRDERPDLVAAIADPFAAPRAS